MSANSEKDTSRNISAMGKGQALSHLKMVPLHMVFRESSGIEDLVLHISGRHLVISRPDRGSIKTKYERDMLVNVFLSSRAVFWSFYLKPGSIFRKVLIFYICWFRKLWAWTHPLPSLFQQTDPACLLVHLAWETYIGIYEEGCIYIFPKVDSLFVIVASRIFVRPLILSILLCSFSLRSWKSLTFEHDLYIFGSNSNKPDGVSTSRIAEHLFYIWGMFILSSISLMSQKISALPNHEKT